MGEAAAAEGADAAEAAAVRHCRALGLKLDDLRLPRAGTTPAAAEGAAAAQEAPPSSTAALSGYASAATRRRAARGGAAGARCATPTATRR